MSQKLQEAMAAARAGEKQTAQHLLVDILEESPEEIQAWFLLSHLVDSETKQVNYLKKVLALDPTHAKARQRLNQLLSKAVNGPAATPLPVSADAFDYEAQAVGDTVPEWMAGEESAVATAVTATEPEIDDADLEIPDWLQTSLDEEAAAAVKDTDTAESDAIEAARQAAKSKPAPVSTPDLEAEAEEAARLNQILTILIIVAVLIVVIMGFFIFF